MTWTSHFSPGRCYRTISDPKTPFVIILYFWSLWYKWENTYLVSLPPFTLPLSPLAFFPSLSHLNFSLISSLFFLFFSFLLTQDSTLLQWCSSSGVHSRRCPCTVGHIVCNSPHPLHMVHQKWKDWASIVEQRLVRPFHWSRTDTLVHAEKHFVLQMVPLTSLGLFVLKC